VLDEDEQTATAHVRAVGVARRSSDPPAPIVLTGNLQVDRFGLIREIARGGMGQVFLARDTKLGRKVAIKFLLHRDPTFAHRFQIEARATARCTHENIVAIYEVGEYQGVPYMVLEYLEGKTLTKVLDTHPTHRQLTEIMLAVARALERAHEDGIVHRDLKPSNIFVTDRGLVKVLDFGVARVFDHRDTPEPPDGNDPHQSGSDVATDGTFVTFSGGAAVVGTLPYMSPEMWGADVVDHQTDLWAVGIMFWRALTGVHPAGTMRRDKLRERLRDVGTPLPSIGERDPSLPRALVQIVDRLLQKPKAKRYRTASQLIRDLKAYLAPAVAHVADDTCPYRGLAAFGEHDAKYFFGRDSEIRTALWQLESWPLLAVIGPSGVGKSSFVHAGLVPAVRASEGNWDVRVLRPGRMPLQGLASTLDDTTDAALFERLPEAPGLYGELLRTEAQRAQRNVLIVVDQLEELFTLTADDDVRRLFLAALLAAADDPSAPVRVVLSMRADFLDRLADHQRFLAELSRGLFFLSAPDADHLRATLVRPAELAGYTFEDASIVEDMLQAATSKGALPLLQFAATRLWDARDRERRLLTVAAYQQMGGVGGAFARHADEVAAAVPSQSQQLLRALLTRLVTPEGTRAVVDLAELTGLSGDHTQVSQILDHLVRARLVLIHRDDAQGATVEIVHEVLITEWPTLARWLEDSQALRGFMAELRAAVKQWLARGKSADLVWHGQTAQDALALVRRHMVELSAPEQEFLAASRSLLASARRRRVYAISAVFGVLAVVIAGGAYFTIQLSRANSAATDKAAEAERAAKTATDAQAVVQAQLDEIKAADAAKARAQSEARARAAEARSANQAVARSQEDLQRAYDQLQREKLLADAEKLVAQQNASKAAEAEAAAQVARAKAEALLATEQARVQQLEQEKKAISTGGLK
jgi:hypothetical protein